MFKSRKKKQQQRLLAAEEAAAREKQESLAKAELESAKYKLLDDIHLAHDFRSSVILPQLNKDLDQHKLSRQQQHLAQLRDIPESPTTMSPPLSPPPFSTGTTDMDGTKQYQELAAWRHQRSQNRYSNGLFGGKQRGRPKPNQIKKFRENETDDLQEVDEEEEEGKDEEEEQVKDVEEKAAIFKTQSANSKPTMEEERITLTPPTIAATITQQVQDLSEDDEEDFEEEEEDEDALMEELYEPDSDTEENFFFQDFSADSKKSSNAKKASRNAARRRRSTKVMSKFDLSSFAQDLHDHRLSVIQPRESRIIMTEDDELELEKLLERQRQRMSMMTMMTADSTDSLVPPPPMPSLDLIKPHQQKQQQEQDKVLIMPKEPVISEQQQHAQQMPVMNSDHGSTTTNSVSSSYSADSFSTLKKNSLPTTTEKDTVTVPQQECTVAPEFTNTAPPPIPTPTSLKPVASISASSTSSSTASPKIDQLKRSVSTTSIKSNHTTSSATVRKRSNLLPIQDVDVRQKARKSLSMDDIHIKLDENEPSVTSAALDWINEDSTSSFNSKISDPTSFVYKSQPINSSPVLPQQSKSRSLFGSLRQVSRSKTHHSGNGSGSGSGIKGLVRNFSSSHKSSNSIDRNGNNSSAVDAGMSRAAMAVIQHNVSKHEQRKAAPVIPQDNTLSSTEPTTTKRSRSRTKSDSANNGSRLIAHLIARASSHTRKHNATKIVNMENEETAAAKKRAQVVRKTIIYVQPDSLHDLLKNGGDGSSIKVPPLPSNPPPRRPKINTRNTMASDGSLSPDDETIRSREYVTATKVVRQTSVRKRVETSESNNSSPLAADTPLSRKGSINNKKRWQLKSVDENELIQQQGGGNNSKHTSSSSSNSSNSSNNNNEYLEGVELREMSDGSVVWGIVKKQGNRKSFFAPNHRNEYEHIEDEEEDVPPPIPNNQNKQHSNTNSLSPPPPIPKRSPRRQVPATEKPTTDIYYSNQMTLPSLLKMMQEQQHPGDDIDEYDNDDDAFNEIAMASVDDQLDEMMRMLQQQR